MILYLNTTSITRSRVGLGNKKMQIDLTKSRPIHVWVGLNKEDDTIRSWKTVEYENIPPYCKYCKYEGHDIGV